MSPYCWLISPFPALNLSCSISSSMVGFFGGSLASFAIKTFTIPSSMGEVERVTLRLSGLWLLLSLPRGDTPSRGSVPSETMVGGFAGGGGTDIFGCGGDRDRSFDRRKG